MKYEDLEAKRAAKQAAKEKSAASKASRDCKRKGVAPKAEAGSSLSQSEAVRAHNVQEPVAASTPLRAPVARM